MGLSFDDLFKMLNSDQKISFIEEMDNMVIEVEEPHEHDDVILNYFNRLSPTDDEDLPEAQRDQLGKVSGMDSILQR